MGKFVVPIKYSVEIGELESEEQLLELFNELRREYERFRESFEILDVNEKPITTFRQFLLNSVNQKSPSIILKGSGNVVGLSVKDSIIKFNLSELAELVRYWDILVPVRCSNCRNEGINYIDQDWTEPYCTRNHKLENPQSCGDYDPIIKGSGGGGARTLDVLIELVSK